MKGYLQNNGDKFYFTIQRNIAPGQKVPLDDVYLSLGKKSGVEDGPEFIEWLSNDFLKGKDRWGLYKEDGSPLNAKKGSRKKKVVEEKEAASPEKTSSRKSDDAKGAGRILRRAKDNEITKGEEITPSLIVEADIAKARGLIDATKNRQLLKKALHLSKHFSKKEQHMRHLIKRLEQI